MMIAHDRDNENSRDKVSSVAVVSGTKNPKKKIADDKS